jgi:hypothetical protein
MRRFPMTVRRTTRSIPFSQLAFDRAFGVVVFGVAARALGDEGDVLLAVDESLTEELVARLAAGDPTATGARAALTAIPAPSVVATPRLAQPTNRRLRAAG